MISPVQCLIKLVLNKLCSTHQKDEAGSVGHPLSTLLCVALRPVAPSRQIAPTDKEDIGCVLEGEIVHRAREQSLILLNLGIVGAQLNQKWSNKSHQFRDIIKGDQTTVI